MTAEARIASALKTLPGQHIVSSSFGAQSAVMLHLVSQQQPDIPIVLIDSGYLFPETYQFVDELVERLALNLKVYAPGRSAAWQEQKHGKRWKQGLVGLAAYNQENKVEPMQRAIEELSVGTWFSGLRRSQSVERADTPFVERSGDRFKVYPIADWTDKDIYDYLKKYDLPYHPLWEKGYVSIGDVHTTKSLAEVDSVEDTRFFGLKRECGLHELDFGESFRDAQSA
jgi:phosphoadenosine phosphosulfate reductase